MWTVLIVFTIALIVESSIGVAANPADHDEPGEESTRERGYVGRHPYLQGDLYAGIARLDLTSRPGAGRDGEWPSISVVETSTSK